MQKAKGTWILIAVLVLLGLAAVADRIGDRLSAATPLTRVGAHPHLLQVRCPDQPSRRFERLQGAWLMTEPWRVPADAEAVDRLLDIARAPARFRYDKGHYDASAFGLDAPTLLLDVDQTRIAFGGVDPVNGLRYVGVGDAAAAVPSRLADVLSLPPEAYVDRRPLAGLYAVKGVRNDGGDWTDGDRAAFARIRAKAVRVLGAAPAGREIDVIDGHDQPWRYRFDEKTGVLARTTPPLAYELAPEDAATIRASLRQAPATPAS